MLYYISLPYLPDSMKAMTTSLDGSPLRNKNLMPFVLWACKSLSKKSRLRSPLFKAPRSRPLSKRNAHSAFGVPAAATSTLSLTILGTCKIGSRSCHTCGNIALAPTLCTNPAYQMQITKVISTCVLGRVSCEYLTLFSGCAVLFMYLFLGLQCTQGQGLLVETRPRSR